MNGWPDRHHPFGVISTYLVEMRWSIVDFLLGCEVKGMFLRLICYFYPQKALFRPDEWLHAIKRDYRTRR